MKKSIYILAVKSLLVVVMLSLFAFSSIAQNTQRGFSFQGFARDFDGAAYSSSNITAQFTISPVGEATVAYTEVQSLTTDAYGVFNAIVGSIAAVDFSAVDFSAKNYKMKVEVRVTGGDYVTISDSELLAVPYAKSADRANNADNADNATSADNGVPPGTVISFAGVTEPSGYLLCNGQEVSKTTYPNLYAAIGDLWGIAGAGNFKLPDLRGQFMRGLDNGAGVDPDVADRTDSDGNIVGDAVGSYQSDANKAHQHTTTLGFRRGTGSYDGGGAAWSGHDTYGSALAAAATNSVGEPESRPKNAYVLFVIKY